MKPTGTGVALCTPFNPKTGHIDYQALDTILDRIMAPGGADFLVTLGTTAETPTLSKRERHALALHVAHKAQGRMPVVIGIGGNCTATVCRELETVDPNHFSAVLSVAPYYNKPSQEGLKRHFTAIADASPVPVILYNVPGRTGVNITADTTLWLAENCPNVCGVKEASGKPDQIKDIIEHNPRPESFAVLSGDDSLTSWLIANGGDGVISVMANALPVPFSTMVRKALQGDHQGAEDLNQRMKELCRLLFVNGNPSGVKSLLSIMGICEDTMRLPLVPVTAATRTAMQEALREFEQYKKKS